VLQNNSTLYSKENDKPNYTMPPSYQTVPLVTPPKDEPSSTSVPMMKKVAVAAMVGMALVGGNAYGSSNNPAMNVNGFTTGSLSSTGGMSTLRVSSHPFCGVGDAPTKCPPGQEVWSISGGFYDMFHCASDTFSTEICAQVCITPSFASYLIFKDYLSPVPRKGSCVSHDFLTATGKNFNVFFATKGLILDMDKYNWEEEDMYSQDAYIFTKYNGPETYMPSVL